MRRIYFIICKFIGYHIALRDLYCPNTFNLFKKNTHLTLYKHISQQDSYGYIKLKEIFKIQIKKI
jgi:hypothetical protein